MTLHKDMLGHTLQPGDIVAYPVRRSSWLAQRIARVVRSDEASGPLLVEVRAEKWTYNPQEEYGSPKRWYKSFFLKKVPLRRLDRVILLRHSWAARRALDVSAG